MLSSGMIFLGGPVSIATSIAALRSPSDRGFAWAALCLGLGSLGFFALRNFGGVLFA